MDEEGIMYLAFCLMVLLVMFSALHSIGSGIFSILAIIIIIAGITLVLMMNFADSVVVSAVFGLLNITFRPAQGYKIVKSQDAIIKEVNGIFYATGYMSANLFGYTFKEETGESEIDEKMVSAPEKWERAVMNVGFPFKYHVLSMGLDVQKVRDEMEGKRSYQEYQMNRALQGQGANDITITNIQREINVIQRKIDRISGGEKPIATVMYVETVATGISEKAALDMLAQQVKALQISLSSMDVDLIRISGREMYTLFNFNFALPLTLEEAASNFDQQS